MKVIITTEMKVSNRKDITTNEIEWIRQLSYFSCLSEISVVFNISSSHGNANLSSRRFLHEKLLISKYLSILHALLHL